MGRTLFDVPALLYLLRDHDAVYRYGSAGGSKSIRSHRRREYGSERVPPALRKKYAYCEILGPRGPVHSDVLILGVVLFAPRTTYPQHHHRGIEQSYVSLAGAWAENDAAGHAPGP